MMRTKQAKIASIVHRGLAEVIYKTPSDFSAPIIEFVEISRDCRQAKIWLSSALVEKNILKNFVKKNRYRWQRELAFNTKLRFTPKLEFIFPGDEQTLGQTD